MNVVDTSLESVNSADVGKSRGTGGRGKFGGTVVGGHVFARTAGGFVLSVLFSSVRFFLFFQASLLHASVVAVADIVYRRLACSLFVFDWNCKRHNRCKRKEQNHAVVVCEIAARDREAHRDYR